MGPPWQGGWNLYQLMWMQDRWKRYAASVEAAQVEWTVPQRERRTEVCERARDLASDQAREQAGAPSHPRTKVLGEPQIGGAMPRPEGLAPLGEISQDGSSMML